jgi:hypothetical protein
MYSYVDYVRTRMQHIAEYRAFDCMWRSDKRYVGNRAPCLIFLFQIPKRQNLRWFVLVLLLQTSTHYCMDSTRLKKSLHKRQGEIPNIRIMYNDIEHSISIDFYIYISIFQVF